MPQFPPLGAAAVVKHDPPSKGALRRLVRSRCSIKNSPGFLAKGGSPGAPGRPTQGPVGRIGGPRGKGTCAEALSSSGSGSRGPWVRGSYRGGRSLCGSCRSRGCSCSRPPGRRHTCPACGWRRAPRHSRWAAGRRRRGPLGGRRDPGPGDHDGHRRTGGALSATTPAGLLLQCLTTSHFPDTQTPRRSVSLQDVPSRAGTMSCRWPSAVVQCRSQGLLEMWT